MINETVATKSRLKEEKALLLVSWTTFGHFFAGENGHIGHTAFGRFHLNEVVADELKAESFQFLGRLQFGQIEQIRDIIGGHFADKCLLAQLLQHVQVVLWGNSFSLASH